MRDHSHHIELSRDEAVRQALAACDFNAREHAIEQVSVTDAYGRVLAADITAKIDVPNMLSCCLDSVAVHWDDFASLAANELPDTSAWVRGTDWEFANTGVAMPAGFDTAIVIEHVEVSPDEQHIRLLSAPSERYAGTRAAGSQMKQGDLILQGGCVITPDVAARIANAGYTAVPVLARPKVAFIPTGNELVPANLPFAANAPDKYAGFGHVFESNSAVVQGKVEAWGGEFVPFDIVPDEYEDIKQAVSRAVEVANIVVLNAGSSKGSDDWSVEVLEEMGHIICHQTNHGPGHHSSYALVGEVPVVGISGPAGGASFTLNFYLLPLMRAFCGLDPTPHRIPARLTADIPLKVHKSNTQKLPGESRPPEATEPGAQFFSIRFVMLEVQEDGQLTATPIPGKAGSPQTQHANALYMMPAGPDAVAPKAGDVILVEMR